MNTRDTFEPLILCPVFSLGLDFIFKFILARCAHDFTTDKSHKILYLTILLIRKLIFCGEQDNFRQLASLRKWKCDFTKVLVTLCQATVGHHQ